MCVLLFWTQGDGSPRLPKRKTKSSITASSTTTNCWGLVRVQTIKSWSSHTSRWPRSTTRTSTAESTKIFSNKVNEAYTVLKSPVKRDEYNRKIKIIRVKRRSDSKHEAAQESHADEFVDEEVRSWVLTRSDEKVKSQRRSRPRVRRGA